MRQDILRLGYFFTSGQALFDSGWNASAVCNGECKGIAQHDSPSPDNAGNASRLGRERELPAGTDSALG
jgi:hypothetical protein